MKKYEKRYENVYSNESNLKKCNLDLVTTDIGLDAEEYIELLKQNIGLFERTFFENLVKYTWLVRRFCYGGVNREKKRRNGFRLDGAFGILMRHYVGTDKTAFNHKVSYRLITYFHDFFPDLDIMNPLKDKMLYPYKNIGLSYLYLVYQMKERLELLEHAEKTKMRYTEFLDYVINYIYCYNEEAGEDKYTWVFKTSSPYVRTNSRIKKYEEKTKTSSV